MRVSLLFAVFLLATSIACSGDVLYLTSLPNINYNDAAGTLRSNIAFGESDPTSTFDATNITFNNSVTINTVSIWSIASVYGEALGREFSEVNLYFRPVGGTWQLLDSAAPDTTFDVPLHPYAVASGNPNVQFEQVDYGNNSVVTQATSYEGDGTAGVYYPIWLNSFGGLSLGLLAGQYQFGIDGVGANPNPDTGYGFWHTSFVNGLLSGSFQSDTSATYLRCGFVDPSGPCLVANPLVDGTWNKGADMNILLTGVSIPEPVPVVTLGIGLLAIGWFSGRRHLFVPATISPYSRHPGNSALSGIQARPANSSVPKTVLND